VPQHQAAYTADDLDLRGAWRHVEISQQGGEAARSVVPDDMIANIVGDAARCRRHAIK
jgi:hypothetical protein